MKLLKLCRVNQSALHSDYFLINSLVYIEHGISGLTKVEHLSNQLRINPTFLQAKKDGINTAGERIVSRLSSNHPIGGCYVY
ncbi:hypothetical protein DET48_111107 [Vibrio diazotrophicus]|uniref:Uncharacterized protein n=1 Tax=Vibrio diazotrophicus TaxID=685 RepID=A0A329E8R2_VIBDI|nr:hypothetical protein DET48_111107 [Vibrio diazotrophicus]